MAPFWVKPAPSSAIESLPNSPSDDLDRTALFADRHESVAVLDMSALDDAALEAEAQRGTKLAEHALRMTLESREIGNATAESLQQQTKQLEGIRDTQEEIGRDLNNVDETVEKLTKSKIRRVAEAPLRKLVGGGRKVWGKDVSDMSEKNVGVQEKGSRDGGRKDVVRKRERVGARVDLLFGREKAEPAETVLADAVPEDDYKDFSNVKVREQLKRQDRYLDETSVQLRGLKELAIGIQNEIEIEAEIVDGIDAPEITHRIRTNHRKIVRALRV